MCTFSSGSMQGPLCRGHSAHCPTGRSEIPCRLLPFTDQSISACLRNECHPMGSSTPRCESQRRSFILPLPDALLLLAVSFCPRSFLRVSIPSFWLGIDKHALKHIIEVSVDCFPWLASTGLRLWRAVAPALQLNTGALTYEGRAYEGMLLGPTLRVLPGDTLVIRLVNALSMLRPLLFDLVWIFVFMMVSPLLFVVAAYDYLRCRQCLFCGVMVLVYGVDGWQFLVCPRLQLYNYLFVIPFCFLIVIEVFSS